MSVYQDLALRIALGDSRDLAGHLALSLARYRESLAEAGRPRPPGMVDLERAAQKIFRGQTATSADISADTGHLPGHRDSHEPELLTQRAAAQAIGMSPKTVSRLIGTGELPHVVVNGVRRVPRRTLEAFLDRRLRDGLDTAAADNAVPRPHPHHQAAAR